MGGDRERMTPQEWQERQPWMRRGWQSFLEDAYNATTDAERDEAWAEFERRFNKRARGDAEMIELARKVWVQLGGAPEDFRVPKPKQQ